MPFCAKCHRVNDKIYGHKSAKGEGESDLRTWEAGKEAEIPE